MVPRIRRRLAVVAAAAIGLSAVFGISAGGAQEPTPGPVPRLIGLTEDEARQALAAAGIVTDMVYTVVRPGKPGTVFSQKAPPGSVGWGSVSFSVTTGLRASGNPAHEFRTTGGGAYCRIQFEVNLGDDLVCWHPRTGRIVIMPGISEFGRAVSVFRRGAIGVRPKGFRTVGFGASWVGGGWNCYSNRQALTCRTEPEAWFRLGRIKGFASKAPPL